MNNDMSELMKNFSQMMNNGQMPDNIKNILNSMNNNTNGNSCNNANKNYNTENGDFSNVSSDNPSTNNSNSNKSNKKNNSHNSNNCNNCDNFDNSKNNNFTDNNFTDKNNSTNNIFGDIDINTILKIQKIMNSMNNDKQNDSRTNLLLSLKPYLKETRKSKVDQYIQLMKMGKVFEIMNPLGGDKKNV